MPTPTTNTLRAMHALRSWETDPSERRRSRLAPVSARRIGSGLDLMEARGVEQRLGRALAQEHVAQVQLRARARAPVLHRVAEDQPPWLDLDEGRELRLEQLARLVPAGEELRLEQRAGRLVDVGPNARVARRPGVARGVEHEDGTRGQLLVRE